MWLLAVLALVLAGAYFFVARDRSRGNGGARRDLRSGAGPLVRIALPSGHPCCEAASELASHRFEPHLAPKLPLADCTMGANCRCRFQSVAERRVSVRRLNRDRRALVRYDLDNPPRRWGPGRRRKDWIGWSGVNWHLWGRQRPTEPSAEDEAPPSDVVVTHQPRVGAGDDGRKERD
jgi:hypothetical protein